MERIAFPTDDGETISRHLGEAQFYLVAFLDDAGKATFEKRKKPRRSHTQEGRASQHARAHARLGPALFAPILDCQVLVSGGMGQPAYDHATAQGLKVLLPAQKNIVEALEAYRTGTLISDRRRIHRH
jgi:predicted Fe-Mo cluster-binding NifX family protein